MSERTERRAVVAWSAFGAAAFLLLPWHSLSAGFAGLALPGSLVTDAESATALWQAFLFRQPGLLWGLAALAACAGSLRLQDPRVRARLLMAAGFGGALWLLAYGSFAPSVPRLAFGWGSAGVLTALVVLGSFGLAHVRPAFKGDLFASAVAVLTACVLMLFVVYPLVRGLAVAFIGDDGRFSPMAAWARVGGESVWNLSCLTQEPNCGVAWNTLVLALLTAGGTTFLGALLALAELRSGWRLARLVRLLAPLPFVAPPFIAALALILLLGRSGLISQALEASFGFVPGRGLYGLPGLWLAQMFSFTPIAYLIVRGALVGLNPALEEAARTMSASRAYIFRRVTLPLLAPAFAHAFLVGFLESVGDFGSPIIIGGSYGVLSTEIFYAILGAQFDGGRAAALALVLASFALGVFVMQRAVLRTRDYRGAEARGRAAPALLPAGWRRVAVLVSLPWLLLTAGLYLSAISAAFVETWGRDFQPTMKHFAGAFGFSFANGSLELTGLAWPSLLNSLTFASVAAVVSALGSMLMAWLLQRNRFPGQHVIELTALMALALPGTVLGLSYVLVFNSPPIELTRTAALIVMCFIFRSLPVGVGIGTAAFRQMDSALEDASRVLGASTARTLWQVALPLLKPALSGSLVYSFVRSMTTVSAVVFLVTAETELATTFIIGRAGQGDYGLVFAYSAVLVLLLSAFMAVAHWLAEGLRLGRVTRPIRLVRAT
ncbi:iron ABC transporter permease [Ramlibacter sp. WS9]|uniref:ABC transporter permease n=1 Tax=Ramlibacter sp. WS9 TaxID=1882741 RepID=UPI001142C5E1|nr:iron ABC transporter permease [Ramlibacter sp. WS9]ROZ64112.1 iron ABC transporter permease [Ramlibacter sp. WS9]